MDRSLITENFKLIQHFDGDKDILATYVSDIEGVLTVLPTTLTQEERVLYFNTIIRILRGPALNIVRREQPSDWNTLKQLLIAEFGKHIPITTLILGLENIKFKNCKKIV